MSTRLWSDPVKNNEKVTNFEGLSPKKGKKGENKAKKKENLLEKATLGFMGGWYIPDSKLLEKEALFWGIWITGPPAETDQNWK